MNKINTFGHAIIHLGKTNVLVHVIAVNHEAHSGVFVYSNINDTQKAAYNLCVALERFAPLKFDPDFDFSEFCPDILDTYATCSAGFFSKINTHEIFKR